MIKYALVISVMITTLFLFEGLAYSAALEETGTQEESKKELQLKDTTQKTRPLGEMASMFENAFLQEMERFLDNQFPDTWEGWRSPRHWRKPLLGAILDRRTLRVDVIEQDNEFLIKAEMPGVDKKDIHITIADNMVTIEADTYKEEEKGKGEYYRREISRGAYHRTLMLPARVKEGEAKASFESGVLELTIPKKEKTKRITIEVE